MYRKRTRTITVITALLLGSVGALAMIPGDPEALTANTAMPSAQAETIASIDAMLGPKDIAPAPVAEASLAPIDRANLPPVTDGSTTDWAKLQTAALTQPAEPTSAPVEATHAIGTSAVNLRSGPSAGADTLSVLQPGQPVQISGEQDGWIEVTLPDGTTGWVFSRYVAGTPAAEEAAAAPPPKAKPAPEGDVTGRTARTEASIAVRSSPSSSARTMFRTEPGERFRIIGTDGNWLQIRTVDGQLGWIERG